MNIRQSRAASRYTDGLNLMPPTEQARAGAPRPGRVHLINPSNKSFGVAVITPRWLYVLAAATGTRWGDPNIVDETLDPISPDVINAGDVVGIGIHTGNALRGYELGKLARQRGAWVVYGGIHPTLFPEEAREHGAAHAVVRGDGDHVWATVLDHCAAGAPQPLYEGVHSFPTRRSSDLGKSVV